MDDINAKRDVRKRRILENSERRLLKITGRNDNTASEGTSSQRSFVCRDEQKEILQSNINGTILDGCNDRIKNANFFKSDDVWNGVSTTSRDKYNDIRTETANIQSTPTRTKLLAPILLTNRVNYILLAFIVNVLLALELDHLFGKAIAVPFFPMMMGRLYICRNTRESQDGSLLYAALILCNIKPQLTYQFKKFATVLHTILGDLALYIFSFTLIHYTLFYCFHKANTLTNLNT